MALKIYKVEYVEYEDQEVADVAIDNVAIYDGNLSAWEYRDNDTDTDLICVESNFELGISADYMISGRGDYERTADNIFKYILNIESIERIAQFGRWDFDCDNNMFYEFLNVKIAKVGEEYVMEEL